MLSFVNLCEDLVKFLLCNFCYSVLHYRIYIHFFLPILLQKCSFILASCQPIYSLLYNFCCFAYNLHQNLLILLSKSLSFNSLLTIEALFLDYSFLIYYYQNYNNVDMAQKIICQKMGDFYGYMMGIISQSNRIILKFYLYYKDI